MQSLLRPLVAVVGVLLASAPLLAAGTYHEVSYPPSDKPGELIFGATYTVWIPDGVAKLRGVIVHQHGCGAGACKGGETAAYDLHWQALAKKWDCALLGPSFKQEDAQNCRLWCDPRNGSAKTFLRALADLSQKAGKPELATVPWCLWGHSGGGFWASIIQTMYPERVVAVWCRSGTGFAAWEKGEIPKPELSDEVYRVPVMCNPGGKEKDDKRFAGAWTGSMAMFTAYRAKGAPISFASDPRTAHECGDSRYLAIPFFDACLAARLPEKGAKDQKLKPIDMKAAWLVDPLGEKAVPAAEFVGKPEIAAWLPNESVAKAWAEYVKTGATSDATAPPSPFALTAEVKPAGVLLRWDAEADFESGLKGFVVLRDGKELAAIPEKPIGRFGRPLFQTMSYHDTPEKPLASMTYTDASARPGEKHDYQIVAVNGVGLKSEPSKAVAAEADKYAAAVAELDKLIAEQVADKRLPAISIALVDDQRIVWSKGYGFQDAAKKVPASAETVYRVGSVSKLFTDVAVMQLVEQGKLDLDAPVSQYIPEFKPKMLAEHKPITLRMLMAHRSGLIREPPVGNYFDPSEPTLKKTVASLNGIDVVYAPGERIKYSNAAIGVVGYTLQKTQHEQFEKYVQRAVLDQLGMKSSSFEPTPAVKKHLAEAVMWTYHGREFPAPTFELGMAPAGCMYSTVTDLAKFTSCLFADGKIGDKQLLKPATIEQMFAPQFAKKDEKFGFGFGLGFMVGELDGLKQVSHGGAVYGFATEWMALPKEKLGAIVVCSRDVANPVVTRIAEESLRAMLAVQSGKPLPKIERSETLPANEARALAGRYRSDDRWLDLTESGGKLFVIPDRGGARFRMSKTATGLISDDVHSWGIPLAVKGETLTRGKLTFAKEKPGTAPPAPPEKWLGLIGEYGWDHNTLFIYEYAGKLHALIEWIEIDPLTEESENVFAFPADRGMYHGEKLIFTRDKSGRATQVEAAKVVFKRRAIDGENGETFKIQSQRPLDQLRKEALAAKPPIEKGEFLKPDLVDLERIDGMKFDIRYATENNFLSTKFYTSAKAYMQRPAAEALDRVHKKLAEQGYGLLAFDAYRPWFVTRMFWDATPVKFHGFVADPSKGSRHNRGCAVDLTLYDLKTGQPVEMVSGYDEFSDRAFPEYLGGTSRQRWHRDLLRRAMGIEGFTVYEEEWWHFDFKDWRKYPIINKTFEELEAK